MPDIKDTEKVIFPAPRLSISPASNEIWVIVDSAELSKTGRISLSELAKLVKRELA